MLIINSKKTISTMRLVLIIVSSVISIRSLPMVASMGSTLIFFYSIGFLFYLLPTALVCSELSSMFNEHGGVYIWISKAFGRQCSMFAIWSGWFNNIIGLPTSLIFIANAILYCIDQNLVHNKMLVFSIMVISIWGCTFWNFFHLKTSSILNMLGTILGIFLPGILIVTMTIFWVLNNGISNIHFNVASILPKRNINSAVFFLGILSSYAGVQIASFHTRDIDDPKKKLPIATICSTLIIFMSTVLIALSIAVVVPSDNLNILSGMFDGFRILFNRFNTGFLLTPMIVVIIISGISMMSSWMIGPARGISEASKQGIFPKIFCAENKNNIPVCTLIIQSTIGTLLCVLFLFIDSLSEAFWIFMVLTSQFTLIMDILIICSALRLRYNNQDISTLYRGFSIPCGKIGIWTVTVCGVTTCIFAIILGFIPPEQIRIENMFRYELLIILGIAIYILIPILIYIFMQYTTSDKASNSY